MDAQEHYSFHDQFAKEVYARINGFESVLQRAGTDQELLEQAFANYKKDTDYSIKQLKTNAQIMVGIGKQAKEDLHNAVQLMESSKNCADNAEGHAKDAKDTVKEVKDMVSNNRWQYYIFIVTCIGMIGTAVVTGVSLVNTTKAGIVADLNTQNTNQKRLEKKLDQLIRGLGNLETKGKVRQEASKP